MSERYKKKKKNQNLTKDILLIYLNEDDFIELSFYL